MDHESLRTASNYLNNLLLARGLLRNGDPIDFVKPSKDTRAQIINLVHDLILREDRDKDEREQVAHSLRQLRSEDARQKHEIERLQAQSDESGRAAAQAQQAERVANAEVKRVEKAMKALQDQTLKLKTTLAQVKTQCANDVKKRDLELARLKTHLQGQQRGTRTGVAAPSMTVRKPLQAPPEVPDVNDAAYSLKQETTEFLTQLSQSLSDENDGLIGLVRCALDTMHEVLGIQPVDQRVDSAAGSRGSKASSTILQAPPTSYEALAVDMESTLEHLKTILTNPNFVSLEEFEREVETRDEEIVSLREGWEHMEQRWREVLGMMQGWLRRMNTGETIKIEDLRMGMGLVTPSRGAAAKGHAETEQDKENVEPEQQQQEEEDSIVDSETGEMDNANRSQSLPPPPPPPASSLSASDGMRSLTDRLGQLDSPKRKRDALEPPDMFDFRPSSTMQKSRSKSTYAPRREAPLPETSDGGGVLPDDGEEPSEVLEVPRMTLAEKLEAAQEAAQEAAVLGRRDVFSARHSQRERDAARALETGLDGVVEGERDGDGEWDGDGERDDDTLGPMPGDETLERLGRRGGSPMAKRTKIRGRPKKRKSTLSPEELESLIVDGGEGEVR
jgi:hypothetical protein